MFGRRRSGILLHPTSLPGAYGIGEIGPHARVFADTLVKMGVGLWQILPLGPTSFGDSPYQALSTFAGNTLMISFDQLREDGLLDDKHLAGFPEFDPRCIDFGDVIIARKKVLKAVCKSFARRATPEMKARFAAFCEHHAYWLEDYALYTAIKADQGGRPWTEWVPELRQRDAEALASATKKFKTAIQHECICQFLFHDQWKALRRYCHDRGLELVGDIPIFVAHDSADVWARPDLFLLEEDGTPKVVAGVPPDYFSETGQLWGNPLYDWDKHKADNYSWWARRMKKIFEDVDIVRIDHFRGFDQYWEIPYPAENAMGGEWIDGPAYSLFDSLRNQLGPLKIIAEDLGIITDSVEALRDYYQFPGMRILQFAFGTDPKAEDYRPESYPANCIVYTGTHDNDTTVGWYHSTPGGNSTRTWEEIEEEKHQIRVYLSCDGSEIHWDLIALAWRSPADTAIAPLQDVMGLGTECRMNVPGRQGGNWQWRFCNGDLAEWQVNRLRDLGRETGRA